MAVRSRRLFGPTSCIFPGSYVVYTVPADRTLIVRDLFIANPSSSAARGGRWLVNGTGVTNQRVSNVLSAGVAGVHQWHETGLILNPADTLCFSVDQGSVNVWGFGSLLFGAPV